MACDVAHCKSLKAFTGCQAFQNPEGFMAQLVALLD